LLLVSNANFKGVFWVLDLLEKKTLNKVLGSFYQKIEGLRYEIEIMEGMTKTAVVLAHYLGGKKTYLEMVSKAS